MAITLDGTTGITTPGLTNTGTETIVNLTTTGNTILGDASTDTLNVGNGGLVKDASGNLGIGVTPSALNLAGYKSLEVGAVGNGILSGNNDTIITSNAYYNTGFKYAANYPATFYEQNNGAHIWKTSASGTAGNAITFTTAMTLDASGNVSISSGAVTIANTAAENTQIFTISKSGTPTIAAYLVSVGGWNGAASGVNMGRNSSTSRSISAGGSINANGADYAEYMTKAGDFTIAKGDVAGIDANGKLTNVFANAVSFVVKSTDPSYVGGDSWGNEETLGVTFPKQPVRAEDDTDETFADKEAQYTADKANVDEVLEAARQLVDRIAFAGQVPVNVLGATAGQYIIPVNDNGAIKGEAVTSPTFEQYQAAVGKVIAIEADGRARIIVKVA
jgi:hypothetical protein